MLRRVHVTHSRWGYALRVTDTPHWAVAVNWLYETALMGLLGHPCCGRGIWGRLPAPLADRICTFAHSGLNVAGRVDWNRERLLLELPVTEEQASVLRPPSPADLEDEDDDVADDDQETLEDDGILLDATCPWCAADFADGEAPSGWAINLLRLHMERRECR
jgi:hypothetical protein